MGPLQLWYPSHFGVTIQGARGREGTDHTGSLPLRPISMWISLYIYSCGKSVLLVFRSFSEIVVPYDIVVLLSMREGFAYSASLNLKPAASLLIVNLACLWNVIHWSWYIVPITNVSGWPSHCFLNTALNLNGYIVRLGKGGSVPSLGLRMAGRWTEWVSWGKFSNSPMLPLGNLCSMLPLGKICLSQHHWEHLLNH